MLSKSNAKGARDGRARVFHCPRAAALLLLAAATGCSRGDRPAGSVQVAPAEIRLGFPEAVRVRLQWQPSRALENVHGRPAVFVHLRRNRDEIAQTFDHLFPGSWEPGRTIQDDFDLFQSALGPPLEPGRYEVSFGLYDDAWGYRWSLETPGRRLGRREYAMAAVTVPSERTPAPSFEFTGGWSPPVPGGSQQTLMRRTLEGDGAIVVRGVPSAGAIRLGVVVPGSFAGSADGPALASSCPTPETKTLGPGFHWLSVRALPGDGPCEIQFRGAQSRGGAERVSLEALAWSRESPR